MSLNAPSETIATVYIPVSKLITVNGKVVWEKGKFKNNLRKVKLYQVDEEYISFEVEHGKWRFASVL